MPQPRTYTTNAQRQAAYRHRTAMAAQAHLAAGAAHPAGTTQYARDHSLARALDPGTICAHHRGGRDAGLLRCTILVLAGE